VAASTSRRVQRAVSVVMDFFVFLFRHGLLQDPSRREAPASSHWLPRAPYNPVTKKRHSLAKPGSGSYQCLPLLPLLRPLRPNSHLPTGATLYSALLRVGAGMANTSVPSGMTWLWLHAANASHRAVHTGLSDTLYISPASGLTAAAASRKW